jgi:hypothetical protein
VNLSFQEKSLWVQGLSLLAVYGLYFGLVIPGPPFPTQVRPEHVGLFVGMVVLLVIAQIVGHSVIAVLDRRTVADERDRLIALQGARNGSFVLATGVFLALCAALLTEGNFLFMHLLLAFWVLAHLVEIGSQLVLYRRGV